MIADLKPYPEYKDSGSPWLGQVPSYWQVQSFRTLTRPLGDRNKAALPLLSVAREKGVFVRSLTDAGENHNVIPEDLSNYKVARVGNLVINKMKAWQGSMGIAPCDGIVSPAYFVFDFRIADYAFGQRLLRSKPYVAHFGQASDGVRVGQWDLSVPGMRQIPVLIPPPAEQSAIVRFLNWANDRLDRAIRAKRKTIALLNEQKQAIIHRAVTRGLDPNVKLKDSGIPWMGDIPEHWDVIPARYLFRAVIRRDRQPDDLKLSVTQRRGLVPTDEMVENSTQAASYDRFLTCHPGDLVLNKYKAHLGVFWAARNRGLITPNYTVFRSLRRANPQFYEILYHTPFYRSIFAMVVYGVTEGMSPLYTQDFYQIPCHAPPVSEQEEIVHSTKNMTQPQTTAITRLEREIELLREYRTRLTADIVTGKLDVRSAAESLPETLGESAEPEPLEETIEDEAFPAATE